MFRSKVAVNVHFLPRRVFGRVFREFRLVAAFFVPFAATQYSPFSITKSHRSCVDRTST